ncbi:hypothetical protein ACWCRD_12330 [Streptomyces sp. NPDC002092]
MDARAGHKPGTPRMSGHDGSEGVACIAFQRGDGHVPPVRPAQDGAQRITMHLDFEVVDLQEAVAHALAQHGSAQ